jgi:hypothetical protein
MSPRALVVHALLCAVAVVFAWRLAHRVEEKQGGPSSITLLDAAVGDVVTVEYRWPRGTTKATSAGSGKDRVVTIDLAREIEPPKEKPKKKTAGDAGPAAVDAGAPADGVPLEKKHEEARFPAGKSVLSGFEALEPLKTRRTLGEVDAGRLKAMGLEAPERSLVVVTKSGKKLELEIGEASFGGQGRYARVKGDSTVHLLEGALATGFEGAADTMMEKRILPVQVEEVRGYRARLGGKLGSYVHRDRQQTAKRKLVPVDDPTSTADEPGKVLTTLRNLRGQKLVTAPTLAGSAVASFEVDVVDKQAPVTIEVLERTDGAGHLVRADAWTFELTETQSKELLDDLEALLP